VGLTKWDGKSHSYGVLEHAFVLPKQRYQVKILDFGHFHADGISPNTDLIADSMDKGTSEFKQAGIGIFANKFYDMHTFLYNLMIAVFALADRRSSFVQDLAFLLYDIFGRYSGSEQKYIDQQFNRLKLSAQAKMMRDPEFRKKTLMDVILHPCFESFRVKRPAAKARAEFEIPARARAVLTSPIEKSL